METIHVGTPIHGVSIHAAAYGKENGEERIYAVSSGYPNMLHIIDPVQDHYLKNLVIEDSHHAWGVVIAKNGKVYIGGDGYLYEYTPGEDQVVNLGIAIEGETYFWRLLAGPDGKVYGGTYPGGKVFSYDPEKKEFGSLGQIVEGQNYVRSLTASESHLYIGLGAQRAQVIQYDIKSGDKKEIPLPDSVADQKFIYDLTLVNSLLFVRVTPSSTLVIYDLEKEEWVAEIPNADGLDVSFPIDGDEVYLIIEEALHSFHLKTLELKKTKAVIGDSAKGFGLIKRNGRHYLVSMKRDGSYWLYQPEIEDFQTIRLDLEGQPIIIQSLEPGPDGNLYIGGYFAGGLAMYNGKELTSYPGVGQIEGMITHKDKLYMGVYRKAKIFEYDPSENWVDGENPKLLFQLDHLKQDRPFEMVSAGELLVIGTVPDYGVLGGALTIYDPKIGEYESFPNLIYNQSIISLVYQDGIIYGATSVWGGLGIEATEKEAKLFAWDMESNSLLWEDIPIPGEKAISALYFDNDNQLWGISGGYLFQYDVEKRECSKVIKIFDWDWEQISHFVRGGDLFQDQDGNLLGISFNRLFRYNRKSGEWTILSEKAGLNQRDGKGNIYFSYGTELYQLKN